MMLVTITALLLAGPPGNPVKWEGPWLPVPGGRARSTIYYGPWQCTEKWMNECQLDCNAQKLAVMGCIWLADLKYEWEGKISFIPFGAGGRHAFTHCCCSYAQAPDGPDRRETWDDNRDAYRKYWSKMFGDWPQSSGKNWPGHHVHDLAHGGDPLGEVLPVPPEVHKLINTAYPACYAGARPWVEFGPERPYLE